MARHHATKRVPDATAVVAHTLESIAREGARAMLERMLAEEIDAFLGRARYAPGGCGTGYRDGYAREREVGIGTWSVPVRAPRVSDLPAGSAPFGSAILHKRRHLSMETRRLFARLYLEGPSSGDLEPAMRELMGEKATLSASTIIRLKAEWAEEHDAFRSRPITRRHAYIWADGIHLGAGPEKENSCLLVVIGAREDGHKELLAMEGEIWPHPAVRDIVEDLASSDIEIGLSIELRNSRGVTMRSPLAGGAQEHELARRYRADADAVSPRSVRKASLLRSIALQYERDARDEDLEAELRRDDLGG